VIQIVLPGSTGAACTRSSSIEYFRGRFPVVALMALIAGCAAAPAALTPVERAAPSLVAVPADTLPAVPEAPAASSASTAAPVPASEAPAAPGDGPPFDAGGTMVFTPGLYHCELNRRVIVRRIGADGQTMVLQWLNKDYTLVPVHSRAGAIRFEDNKAGLAWIVIVGKSMLLDTRKGQQLANECKL
jgi:hypothetical protein